MQNAGYVYAITNTLNGGRYIGSTNKYKRRWADHRAHLNKGTHHSFVLQRAWDKYGAAAFAFEVLCICPAEQRIDYEKRLMSLQRYNVARTPVERSVRGGWTHTEEFKQGVSRRFKGGKLTEVHKEKLRSAGRGRKRSTAFKEKARLRQLGKSPSGTTRTKLSEAVRAYRAEKTKETREKVLLIYAEAVAGGRVGELCTAYGISTSTFNTHYRAAGLVPPKHGEQLL